MTHAHKTSLRRTACDLCLAHKLKCLRDAADQPKCNRCTRLNTACQVGKAGRPGRPRKQDAACFGISIDSTTTPTHSSPHAPVEHSQFAEGRAQNQILEIEPPGLGVGSSVRSESDDQSSRIIDFQSIPAISINEELYDRSPSIDP